ncbi:hypothetical protein V8D89_003933 [Ganoderma adspersum]
MEDGSMVTNGESEEFWAECAHRSRERGGDLRVRRRRGKRRRRFEHGARTWQRAHELHPNNPPAPSHPKPPSRAPAPKPDDDVTPQPPEGPSTEYRLMASKLNGWKYDVMKFESRKRIEINASGFLACRIARAEVCGGGRRRAQ